MCYAATLADSVGAELHLLHVLDDVHALVSHPDFTSHGELALRYFMELEEKDVKNVVFESEEEEGVHDFLRTLEADFDEKLAALHQDDLWKRLKIIHAVRYGNTVKNICRYALKNSIDLLVVGSHGRSSVGHFLMGSVAERVARAAPCPVLIARKHQREFVAFD